MSKEPRRWIAFDPTIHAGHLLTALSMLVSALGLWFMTQNTLSNHEVKLAEHAHRMDAIEAHATAERERTDRKFDSLVQDNNQALTKLRDDMNQWFMTLNDKLDRKADKR